MPDVLYDGTWATPTSVGAKRFQYPFRNNGDRVSALFEEDYWQRETFYLPQELSTPHSGLSDYYLIHETEPANFGFGDLVKFTRTYARVPAQQVEHSSILVTLPEPSSIGKAGLFGRHGALAGTFTRDAYLFPNFLYQGGTYYEPIKVSTAKSFSLFDSVFTVPNHGFSNGEKIVGIQSYPNANASTNTSMFHTAFEILPQFKFDEASQNSNYDIIGNWAVINANAIRFHSDDFPNFGNIGFTKYSRSNIGSGSKYVRCKRITDYYLPGITPGIATVADIPLPADHSGSREFIDALLAGTGTMNIQVGELQRWRESPIYCITKTTIEIEDLV